MAQVTLSIVSHGQGSLVESLLRDLSHQTMAPELDVVLTLNIPEPDPDAELSRGLNLTILRNSRSKGFGANHNAALRHAETPWVIVLNPDIRINDPRLIERLIERHPGAGLVAPLILNSQGGREDSIRRNLDPVSLLARKLLRRKAAIDPTSGDGRFLWVAGMFMALPLATWKAIGGFDDRFFLYCEDYDLCARLATRGYPIVIDETLHAIHDAQRASRRSLKYLKWHLGSLMRVWTRPHLWRIWASDLKASRRRRAGKGPAGPRHTLASPRATSDDGGPTGG